MDLYDEGIISEEQAKEHATSASDLKLKMSGLNSGKGSDTNVEVDDDVFDLKD